MKPRPFAPANWGFSRFDRTAEEDWVPAFAGMTKGKAGMTKGKAGMAEGNEPTLCFRAFAARRTQAIGAE